MRRLLSGLRFGRQALAAWQTNASGISLAHDSSSTVNCIERSIVFSMGQMRYMSDLPSHTKLGMPALSPTMSQGNLVEWKVQEGQEVTAGDVLAEVETDKAVLGWENQDDGIVAKLLVPNGAQGIEVGQVVAIMVDEAEDVAAFKDYSSDTGSVKEETVSGGDDAQGGALSQDAGNVRRASPAARILMELHALDPSSVTATGPKGIITKGDVLEAVSSGVVRAPAQPSTPVAAKESESHRVETVAQPDVEEEKDYVDIPTTNMRKIIARRLLESKTTVPHMYIAADVVLDKILAMRKSLAANGIKISVNDCVLRASALALEQVPAANSFWSEEQGKPVHAGNVDVSVAVATKGGLFTPIVKNANMKSLSQISADVRELATKARENKLKPEEYQGGSFSVSNLGMFGVDSFSAIINPPQGAIMAVGGGRKVAKPGPDGMPVSVTEMTVTLSADSRVFDGQTAADFLEAFKANMEDPFRLSIV